MRIDSFVLWFGGLAVTAFFAIAFLQSALDKLLDRQGNLDFFNGHFANSPLKSMVVLMFWSITLLEAAAGLLSALGVLQLLFATGKGLAIAGLTFSLLSLWCLFFGQRIAKDYGGAAVLASYYAVALVGLLLLGCNPA